MGRTPGSRVVTEPDDPRLDPYRSLRATPGEPRLREKRLPHVVIEGHLALRRSLTGPIAPTSVLISGDRLESLRDLVSELPHAVELLVASGELIEEVTGFDVHRGVLAAAPRPEPIAPAELLDTCGRIAVLQGLGDLENTGAVFRVAAALGIDGVLLDHRCADPLYRRCIRVSLGWSTVVPHSRTGAGADPVRLAADAGFTTVALTPSVDSVAVDAAARSGMLADPVALLVGAEGAGLPPESIEAAEVRVRIPMPEEVDSLNAATALAVAAAFAASVRGWS